MLRLERKQGKRVPSRASSPLRCENTSSKPPRMPSLLVRPESMRGFYTRCGVLETNRTRGRLLGMNMDCKKEGYGAIRGSEFGSKLLAPQVQHFGYQPPTFPHVS